MKLGSSAKTHVYQQRLNIADARMYARKTLRATKKNCKEAAGHFANMLEIVGSSTSEGKHLSDTRLSVNRKNMFMWTNAAEAAFIKRCVR